VVPLILGGITFLFFSPGEEADSANQRALTMFVQVFLSLLAFFGLILAGIGLRGAAVRGGAEGRDRWLVGVPAVLGLVLNVAVIAGLWFVVG